MMNDMLDLINDSNNILILTHENPDGDAIGSAMGCYEYLSSIGKSTDIVIPDFPPVFNFLPRVDEIITQSNKNYDLAIVVDCSNIERIGQNNKEIEKCKKIMVIDHHLSNTMYGNINYVEEKTASCAQIIYYLFKQWKIDINMNMGLYLMTGSITDTCGFRNGNVDKNTFLMAADLADIGVNIHNIYYLTLLKKNQAQYQLMRMALDRLEILADGKIAFSYVSKEDMENVGAVKGDHEGLVEFGRNIDGVEVSIFMREDNGYNVSLRSSGRINVENIAHRFGGGGHKMAAGVKIKKDFKETKKMLIDETIKELS